jgi:hypothetical protein
METGTTSNITNVERSAQTGAQDYPPTLYIRVYELLTRPCFLNTVAPSSLLRFFAPSAEYVTSYF